MKAENCLEPRSGHSKRVYVCFYCPCPRIACHHWWSSEFWNVLGISTRESQGIHPWPGTRQSTSLGILEWSSQTLIQLTNGSTWSVEHFFKKALQHHFCNQSTRQTNSYRSWSLLGFTSVTESRSTHSFAIKNLLMFNLKVLILFSKTNACNCNAMFMFFVSFSSLF